MEEQVKKIPKLRFPEFKDEWKNCKLDDILDRRIEHRQQSEDYPRLAFASGQGVIPLSERKTNNREQLTKDEFTKMYLVTEMDDIVYNPANVKYGAIDRNKYGRGLISPIYVTFTTKEVPGFIERIVTSHSFKQKALRFEEGTVTKRQSVNPEDLVTIEVSIAPQKAEQEKVSKFFDSIDALILLYQNKIEALEKYKAGMLQKMFPKEGKSIPEIRFSGFNDEWKRWKYKDLGNPLSGGNLSYDDLDEGGEYKCILYGELYTRFDAVIRGIVNRTNRKAATVLCNDILFPQSTTADSLSLISPACMNEDAAETAGVFIIRPNDNIDGNFVCYYTKGNENQRRKLAAKAQGSTIIHLYYQSIKDEPIMLPSYDEQKAISKFFMDLDNLIRLHQRKIDEFENTKRGLLQQMFV